MVLTAKDGDHFDGKLIEMLSFDSVFFCAFYLKLLLIFFKISKMRDIEIKRKH